MVDGEVLPYLRRGMDVDARLAVGHLGEHAGDEGHAGFVKEMRQTVVQHDGDRRVAEHDFLEGLCGRVAAGDGIDVGEQQTADLGQGTYNGRGCGVSPNLDGQQMAYLPRHIILAIYFGEDGLSDKPHHVLQRIVRRQMGTGRYSFLFHDILWVFRCKITTR